MRASLQQGDFDRQPKRLGEQRHIASKQLILQGAGAGGDDDAAARQQCRDEIGESFSRAGSRLDDQRLQTRQRRADRFRHRRLFGTIGVTGQCASQRPALAEHIFVVRVHAPLLHARAKTHKGGGVGFEKALQLPTNMGVVGRGRNAHRAVGSRDLEIVGRVEAQAAIH